MRSPKLTEVVLGTALAIAPGCAAKKYKSQMHMDNVGYDPADAIHLQEPTRAWHESTLLDDVLPEVERVVQAALEGGEETSIIRSNNGENGIIFIDTSECDEDPLNAGAVMLTPGKLSEDGPRMGFFYDVRSCGGVQWNTDPNTDIMVGGVVPANQDGTIIFSAMDEWFNKADTELKKEEEKASKHTKKDAEAAIREMIGEEEGEDGSIITEVTAYEKGDELFDQAFEFIKTHTQGHPGNADLDANDVEYIVSVGMKNDTEGWGPEYLLLAIDLTNKVVLGMAE